MTGESEIRVPTHAMVLAAGLGLRMRPLTQTTPKPLLEVGGRPMLDHALDRLQEAGVTQVVVNTHWLPEKIEDHLRSYPGPRTHTPARLPTPPPPTPWQPPTPTQLIHAGSTQDPRCSKYRLYIKTYMFYNTFL